MIRPISGPGTERTSTPKLLPDELFWAGVDVGAEMAIYEILRGLAADGVAVIVVSSELEEVLGLSHRVLVMSGGRQEGVLSRAEATPQAVMRLAVRDLDLDDNQTAGATAGPPVSGKES
jgi:ribose transport system ATP-binding protein